MTQSNRTGYELRETLKLILERIPGRIAVLNSDWLVVAGARATFKGVGTINEEGEYGFMVTAIDSQVPGGGEHDRFRIKIWDLATEVVVYDNQRGLDHDTNPTILGGGNIVIHKK